VKVNTGLMVDGAFDDLRWIGERRRHRDLFCSIWSIVVRDPRATVSRYNVSSLS
jgi:hypothetical protein